MIIRMHDYPNLMKAWLTSESSIEDILRNSGVKSAIVSDLVRFNLKLEVSMNDEDYTWFMLSWS